MINEQEVLSQAEFVTRNVSAPPITCLRSVQHMLQQFTKPYPSPNVPIPTSPVLASIHTCHCLHLQTVCDPFTDCNLDDSDLIVF